MAENLPPLPSSVLCLDSSGENFLLRGPSVSRIRIQPLTNQESTELQARSAQLAHQEQLLLFEIARAEAGKRLQGAIEEKARQVERERFKLSAAETRAKRQESDQLLQVAQELQKQEATLASVSSELDTLEALLSRRRGLAELVGRLHTAKLPLRRYLPKRDQEKQPFPALSPLALPPGDQTENSPKKLRKHHRRRSSASGTLDPGWGATLADAHFLGRVRLGREEQVARASLQLELRHHLGATRLFAEARTRAARLFVLFEGRTRHLLVYCLAAQARKGVESEEELARGILYRFFGLAT